MMFFKRVKALVLKVVEVPCTEHPQPLEAVQLWEVRWESRYDIFAGSTRPEIEVFTSEEEATEFAKALRAAFKLIKHTSGTSVSVRKR